MTSALVLCSSARPSFSRWMISSRWLPKSTFCVIPPGGMPLGQTVMALLWEMAAVAGRAMARASKKAFMVFVSPGVAGRWVACGVNGKDATGMRASGGNDDGFLNEVRVDIDAEAGTAGNLDNSVAVAAKARGGAVLREFVVELLELVEGAGVGDGGDEMHHVDVAQAG